jgi:hypothetical protein
MAIIYLVPIQPHLSTPQYKKKDKKQIQHLLRFFVLSNSTSVTISGVLFPDVLSTDYIAAGGDSGGIVYTSSCSIVGIHKAGPSTAIPGTRYVIKAGGISAFLNVQPD